jgi:hypothetical protein
MAQLKKRAAGGITMASKKENKMSVSPSLQVEEKITRKVQKPPTRGTRKRSEIIVAIRAVLNNGNGSGTPEQPSKSSTGFPAKGSPA